MEKIKSEKITKPIQLLASWLVGLVSINILFLVTALKITGWQSTLLIIASIVNVPLFLICIFILQTKFRPELQEDLFYAEYLSKKTNKIKIVPRRINNEIHNKSIINIEKKNSADKSKLLEYSISINDYLSNFKEIRALFKDKNIPIHNIFGKTYGTDSRPKGKIVSINYAMSFAAKIELFTLLLDFKLDGYNYYDPSTEPDGEDVVIGSYNSKRILCPFNNEFKKMLMNKPELVDLLYFEKDYISHPFYTEDELMENYLNSNN